VIELLSGLPDGVIGFEAVGEVSVDDYKQTLIPAVEAALEANGKVRLLYVLGERFEGLSAGAAWEDTKLGLEHLRGWERMAVVTDIDWIAHAIKAVGWMIPAEVRIFPTTDRKAAETWVSGAES
jgi:SpoIIAA-like